MNAQRKREAKAKTTQRDVHEGAAAHVEERRVQSFAGWLRRLDWRLVALMLAIKLLIFVFAVHAFYLLSNTRTAGLYGWLEIWNRWDAPHYLDIARDGYVTTGEQSRWLVFYPLLPWLTRVFALFTGGDYLIGAFLVSTIASIAAGLLFYRLAALDETEAVARRAVWFLFIFPTSYFLHIGYTESLFIAISVGCFLAARRGRWWVAGVLAALAGLTRVNGLILIPALAVEALQQYRETRRLNPQWLWILFAGLGFGLYLLINKQVTGDAFAFQKIASEHWSKSLTWPWVGIREVARSMWWRAPAEAQMVGVQEFVFILLGLLCTVWCWKEFRPSYGVWMTLNWLLWTSTSFILSAPRYTLIMFPIYLLFARLAARRPFWDGLITVWSLLFLALFVSQFVQGRWAF